MPPIIERVPKEPAEQLETATEPWGCLIARRKDAEGWVSTAKSADRGWGKVGLWVPIPADTSPVHYPLRPIQVADGHQFDVVKQEDCAPIQSGSAIDELLSSPGHAYMRTGAAGSIALMILAVLVVAEVNSTIGLVVLWSAAAVFFFCNFAAARLSYPFYVVGPAVAMFASLGCFLLALTTIVAAVFG